MEKMGDTNMAEDPDGGLILLVDDMPLKRAFITQFLKRWASEANLNLVASDFDNFDDVMALERPTACRLVILSLGAESLSDPRVLAAHRVLTAAHEGRRIIVLGDRPDAENIERGLQLGVAGYIPTSVEADVAVAALNFVLAGGSYFPPEALIQLGQPHATPPQEPQLSLITPGRPEPGRPRANASKTNGGGETSAVCGARERSPAAPINVLSGDLTSRQQQVLACLKRARSNKEIAHELSMSEATVKVHVRQVMKKLGAVNRTHAAVLAVDLVSPEEKIASNVAQFLGSKTVLQHARPR